MEHLPSEVLDVEEVFGSQESGEVKSAELDPNSISGSQLSKESKGSATKESTRLSKSKSARSDTPVPSGRKSSNDEDDDEEEEPIAVPEPNITSAKSGVIEEVTEETTKKSIFKRPSASLVVKILIIFSALICAGAAVLVEPSWMKDTYAELYNSIFAMVQATEAGSEMVAEPMIPERIPQQPEVRVANIPTKPWATVYQKTGKTKIGQKIDEDLDVKLKLQNFRLTKK